MPIPDLDDMIAGLLSTGPLSEASEDVFRALWDGGGLPVRYAALEDAVFGWREDGGPSMNAARLAVNAAIAELQEVLANTPFLVRRATAGWRLTIEIPRLNPEGETRMSDITEIQTLGPIFAEAAAVSRAMIGVMPDGIHLATEGALIEAVTTPVANIAETIVALEATNDEDEKIRRKAIAWLNGH